MTVGMRKISIYKDIFDKTSTYTITVENALKRIKNGHSKTRIIDIRNEPNEERQSNLKDHLPSVTFSGIFSSRFDENIVTHSGLICLDFDHIDIPSYLEKMRNWEYCYAAWISPRNNGIKVLVKISDGKKHREHFEALRKVYPEIDLKCKNESRVCYESYDPNLFIHEESKTFTECIKFEVISTTDTGSFSASDHYEVYKKLLSWLERKGNIFSKGNRNYFVFVLAGAMCRFGVYEDDTIRLLQTEYSTDKDFSIREIEKSVRSAYKKNKQSAGTVEFKNEQLSSKETKYEIDPKIFDEGYTPDDVIYGTDVYSDALDVYENGYRKAETTFIPQLDVHFKWKKGELTVLSGIGNYGKSHYINQLQLIKALKTDTKWAVFSPESAPASEYYFDLTEALIGCPCDGGYYKKPPKAVFEKAYKFVSEHFFFIYSEKLAPSPEFIKMKFMELIIKEKCEGVIIDPFNQLANDYTKQGRDDKYLETFLGDCLKFARQNNIYFVIVAHPHKMQKEGQKDYPCPDVYDLAGGAMWNHKCDNILVYHRPMAQSDPESPLCQHHSKKIRKEKMIGKKGFFDFELKRLRRRFYFNGFNPLDGNEYEVAAPPEQMKITPNRLADDDYNKIPDDQVPF